MIFDWVRKKPEALDFSETDLGQKPVYNEDELKFRKLVDDILVKLDEIQVLIRDLKQEEKK
jgi:hypothetical protein